MKILLLFPHQLFARVKIPNDITNVALVEDPLFFGDTRYPLSFHKQKLVFHRATMKAYEEELTQAGLRVSYVEYKESLVAYEKCEYLTPYLKGVTSVAYFDTVDYVLEKRLSGYQHTHTSTFSKLPSPSFFLDEKAIPDLLIKTPYKLTPFYCALRKRFNILMDNGLPRGGSWTYDVENRKKIPNKMVVPESLVVYTNKYIDEATKYITTLFPNNYGSIDQFYYATTRKEAEAVFQRFLEERFALFGPYEDAIKKESHVLFHSVISMYLNNGLLDPVTVVTLAISYADAHDVPVQSLEGFVRQILGWREFIRAVYVQQGSYQRTRNFFGYTKKIPETFWTGETGIEPIDTTIKKVLKTAYAHHIERLMVMGNYMLLNEYDPDDTYKWFMELFIDAYDWVMVPNVYAMICYADGGMMTTKPYVSGANYVLKMSDYTTGEWAEVWTKKYWDFIYKHEALFSKNPRMRMLLSAAKNSHKKESGK